jgi:hypothetical protein
LTGKTLNPHPEAKLTEEQVADVEEQTAAQRQTVADQATNLYRQNRVAAAELSRELTSLEMDRTAMRSRIIKGLMDAGLKVTAATEQARTTPEYVQISKDIVDKSLEWELAFVAAECARMTHQNVTMAQLDTYTQRNTLVELENLRKQIDARIRQVQS